MEQLMRSWDPTKIKHTTVSTVLAECAPTGPLGETYIQSLSQFMLPSHRLAYKFAHNICSSFNINSSPRVLHILDAAHVSGWASYSLFDSVVDANATQHIPTATTALRISYSLFLSAATELGVPHSIIDTCFETMDKANYWEITHARSSPGTQPAKLPQYHDLSQLAKRSWGNSLTLQILLHRDNRLRPSLEFMHNYLIIRQLFDDIKDWRDDYANGHLSYVVTKILRHKVIGTRHGNGAQQAFLLYALPDILKTCSNILHTMDRVLADIGEGDNDLFKLWRNDAKAKLVKAKKSLNGIGFLHQDMQSI